jgi:hypothetical protein
VGWGDVVMTIAKQVVLMFGSPPRMCVGCCATADKTRAGAAQWVGAGVCNEVRQREQGATAVCSSGLAAVFVWGVGGKLARLLEL